MLYLFFTFICVVFGFVTVYRLKLKCNAYYLKYNSVTLNN